jgi:arylsulfatase A
MKKVMLEVANNNLLLMRKIELLSLVLLQLASTSVAQQTTDAVQQKKPNIIFILGDDIGYYIPTVNGGQSYSTPNIDSLAKGGMNFKHCEAMPLCNPSRFLFLTGKYNNRNYSNWGYMDADEQTIGNLMRGAGYATGFFGKLQLQFSYAMMNNWGFDTYTVVELTEDSMPPRRYKNPVLVDNKGRVPDSATFGKYGDDIFTQRIFDFIDSNKGRPFFVYYPMAIGHEPYCPTPDDSAFATWNPIVGAIPNGFRQ